MADEVLVVSFALKTISAASHESIVSCLPELFQANLAIAKALLLHSQQGHQIEVVQNRAQNGNQTWISRPETAIVDFAQHWLQRRLAGSEYISGQKVFSQAFDIRKAVISSSPVLIALLRKFAKKRKRSAQVK
jgi:hypothetical protein